MIRLDTDRGALYGPTVDAIIDEFFGRNQSAGHFIHRLMVGAHSVWPIVVQHNGGWLPAARVGAVVDVDDIPSTAQKRPDARFAVGPSSLPALQSWVYEHAHSLAVGDGLHHGVA